LPERHTDKRAQRHPAEPPGRADRAPGPCRPACRLFLPAADLHTYL